jgi:hypothetical protein
MENAPESQHPIDAAHLLDCGPDDFLEMARKRRLKATKVGRLWRYCLGDVRIYKVEQEAADLPESPT